MALIDHFLPALAFSAMLGSEPNLAETPYETARGDLERLLDEALAQASLQAPEAADHAHFAVCAFADEAVLDSAWPGREIWIRHKLQEVRFNTANAGLEFYQRLEQLCADRESAAAEDHPRREVLEVYAACLTLGFRGQYNGENCREQVAQLADGNLRQFMGDRGLSEARIFPEAYAVPLPEPEPARLSPAVKALMLFGAPLLLALIIYASYSSLLSAFVSKWLGAL